MIERTASRKIDRPANSRTGWPISKLLAATAAASVGAVAYLGGPSDSGAREAPRQIPRVVDVAEVRAAPPHREVRFSGLVRAQRRGRLAFTLGGRVVARPAQVGDRVKRGDLLAALDTAPLVHARRAAKARLDDADAQLAQLERDLARAERLLAKKAGVKEAVEKTRAARDATTARRSALSAQLSEADRQLREARLTAPFTGTVLDVLIEPGETTSPGAPVVVLSAEEQLEVEVQVPESVRAHLEQKAPVQVELPLAGVPPLTGRIAQLGRAASGAGALFPVIVQLDEAPEGVVPGFTADVRLRVRRPEALMVPVPAVSDPGGRAPFVYRVKDGLAERVPVRVSGLGADGVFVQSSLRVGDEVVVRGHASLLPEEAVEVRR